MLDVNTAVIISITPCPKANKNNMMTAGKSFSEKDAIAIILANIGVEQGEPASANRVPRMNG